MSTDHHGPEPKTRKITVSDRRHHASGDEEAGDTTARSPYPSIVEELKARTEAAERKAAEAREAMEAEVDAVRERLNRDVARRVGEGKAELLAPLLDVLDNIRRAAEAAERESGTIGEGVALIGQQLEGLLKQQGVEAIETVGLPYDPHVAEAVGVEAVEDEDKHDIVLEEFQTGYRFGETILRPARVKVGKSG